MKQLFSKSAYTSEPKSNSDIKMWDNHWNYEWGGRNSISEETEIKCRKEEDGNYLIQDNNGIIWLLDEVQAINEGFVRATA